MAKRPPPQVTVRHHLPQVPDAQALERARELWSRGLIKRFKATAIARRQSQPDTRDTG